MANTDLKILSKHPSHAFYCLIIVIFLITNQLISCKPDEPQPPDDCTECGPFMLNETADYLLFGPGSWWVYKETYSGKFDSIYMRRSQTRVRKVVGEKRTITYEHIDYQQISGTTGATYTYDQLIPFPDGFLPFVYKMRLDKSRSDPYVGHTQPFGWPVKIGETVDVDGSNETFFKGAIDSMEVQDIMYFNVLHFETTNDASFVYGKYDFENGGPTEYYWAKGIGLIKNNSLNHPKNWELTKYSIIK